MKVNCQRITHVGCCIKRKPIENITDRLPTGYRHITNSRPTVGQLLVHCRPTGSLYFGQNLSADCRPTDDQLSADCRPTVDQQSADRFFGSSSSQLPNFVFFKIFLRQCLTQQIMCFEETAPPQH